MDRFTSRSPGAEGARTLLCFKNKIKIKATSDKLRQIVAWRFVTLTPDTGFKRQATSV